MPPTQPLADYKNLTFLDLPMTEFCRFRSLPPYLSYPLCFHDSVNTIPTLIRRPAQQLCNLVSHLWPAPPEETPPDPINDNQFTVDGLSLRDALAVRSAEFWLALGEPRMALKELESLTELARQHAWPQRVQLHAQITANPISDHCHLISAR